MRTYHNNASADSATLADNKRHSAIARELCKYAGVASRGSLTLEDLLNRAVDILLATKKAADSHMAEIIYSRYCDACVSWRTVGADIDESKQLVGVSEYSRGCESSLEYNENGQRVTHVFPLVTSPRQYHQPRDYSDLAIGGVATLAPRPPVVATDSQTAKRIEFARTLSVKLYNSLPDCPASATRKRETRLWKSRAAARYAACLDAHSTAVDATPTTAVVNIVPRALTVEEIAGPSFKQKRARSSENMAKTAQAKRKHVDNAAKQRAYRERKKADAKAKRAALVATLAASK